MVEQALILFNKLKTQHFSSPSSKELNDFLCILDEQFKTDFYEPRITHLMLIKKDLLEFLDRIHLQQDFFKPALAKIISEKSPFIKSSLNAWHDNIFKNKIAQFIEGNQHIKHLPVHNDPDRFYIMVKELNPLKLIVRHPLTEIQAASQAERAESALLSFDEKDPIIAARVWAAGDRGNAPGSCIRIIDGHHRIYEIYRRYLQGRIDGNALIEAVKG